MMNFGLSRLRLVQPDEFDPWRIGGIAHRSASVTESATLHETLGDAATLPLSPSANTDFPLYFSTERNSLVMLAVISAVGDFLDRW